MKKMLKMPSADKVLEFLKRYKFLIIIIAAGVLLLAVPIGDKSADLPSGVEASGEEKFFSVEELETRLGEILSKIEGAGEVSVMLTVHSGTERILATDREQFDHGDESELREDTVIISTENGEEAVLIVQNYPVFRGALVVCPGGDDPKVVLMLTKALSGLTGLSSGRITVCKGV